MLQRNLHFAGNNITLAGVLEPASSNTCKFKISNPNDNFNFKLSDIGDNN